MHKRRNQSRKWLREASMKRLSLLVKDKTELIDSAQKLRMTVLSLDGLEESGLSSALISHLQNWVDGKQLLLLNLVIEQFLFFSLLRRKIWSPMYVGFTRVIST